MRNNKTIAVTLRFWSTGLELNIDGTKKIACKDSGSAIIEANSVKGIRAESIPFACYEDIIPAVKELFRKNHIHVVSNNRHPRIT